MTEFDIRCGYTAGSIGRISELHGVYYHQYWDFGLQFEAKVATELSEFLHRYDEYNDRFWVVVQDGRIEGSIAIDGSKIENEGAHLRWFIISDILRGRGLGRKLLIKAVEFCKIRGYEKIHLWTFEGLNPARHLYEEMGFHLVKQQSGTQWGTVVNEQYFVRDLIKPANSQTL